MSTEQLNGVDERGIPTKSDYPPIPITLLYPLFNIVLGAVGLGIAFVVYFSGAINKYDAKIALLASYDLGWMYLGLIAIKIGILIININLGVNRKAAKVNVPDQQVYTVYTGSNPALGYVLMEQDGDLGRFNRAQRALQNLFEQLPVFLAGFAFAGFVFPFPCFILACYFMAMRAISAFGYTSRPKGRMAGTILGSIGLEVLQGFIIIIGVKAIMRAA